MSYTGPFIMNKPFPTGGQPMGEHVQYVYRSNGSGRKPIPYLVSKTDATSYWAWNTSSSFVSSQLSNREQAEYAKAYDRYWSKAHKQAQVALSLLEAERSIVMLTGRLRQARDILINIRKGDIGGLYQNIGLVRRTRLMKTYTAKDVGRKSARTWLEYTFGWMPLIQDCATAVEVLQQDFNPLQRVKGTSHAVDSFNTVGVLPGPGNSNFWHDDVSTIKSTVSGCVSVTNPNLFLANQLGFVNPAAIAWDVVPFSFVLDWFLPVGKFLNSFTNDFGCEVVDPAINVGCTCSVILTTVHQDMTGELFIDAQDTSQTFFFARKIVMHQPGILARARIPQNLVWNAVTSASLLMQEIGKWKR